MATRLRVSLLRDVLGVMRDLYNGRVCIPRRLKFVVRWLIAERAFIGVRHFLIMREVL